MRHHTVHTQKARGERATIIKENLSNYDEKEYETENITVVKNWKPKFGFSAIYSPSQQRITTEDYFFNCG